MSPFMNRTDRLYAIVEQLRRNGRRGCTAEWLAQQFEVSTRTVKRDICALQSAGTPIISQEGRGGGYQLADETLPPVVLTSAEVGAIAVALGSDPHLPFAPDGRTALTKLLRTMSAAQRDEIARITSAVWVRSGGARGASSSCIRTVDEAVRRGVALTIDYVDRAGRTTKTRRVDPLAVVRTEGRWYILAWCHVRVAGRWLRFDRIRRATLTKTPVAQRDLVQVFGPPPTDAQPVSMRLNRV
jgi:predicted DNA-binding transcriptional regulator YafY